VDQRQGGLALGQVVAKILAQRRGVGGVVEHVVGDLEGITQIEAISVQCGTVARIQIAKHRAQARGGGEQHRGLAFDHAQVGGLVHVRIVDVQELQHLAFGDGVGGVGQHLHHRHAIQFDHQLEAARIEEVADQHAGGVAPQRVGGLAPAPQVGLVHHVVVQEGGGMDEFDHRRQLQVILAGVAERARRDQVQLRAQALAAGPDDVLAHLVDQQHVGRQPRPDQGIDPVQIVFHEPPDRIGGQGCRGRRRRGGGGNRHWRIIRSAVAAFRCANAEKSQARIRPFPGIRVATIY
jgi:hypothetical protein